MDDLSKCVKIKISSFISLLKLPHPIPALERSNNIDPCIIYERFNYSKITLLGVRFKNKVLMSGTAGIGKSSFIYYYMARIINSHRVSEFGPLPLDSYGSKEPPKVIVRRDGDDYTFYFIDEKKAYKYTGDQEPYQLINCFQPEKTVYLYSNPSPTETNRQRTTAVANLMLACPCPILVIIDINKIHPKLYSNIMSNPIGARRIEMLFLWPLPDLIAISAYHNSNRHSSTRQNYDQIESTVTQRFKLFGGVLKSLLNYSDVDDTATIQSQIDAALDTIDFRLLWNARNMYMVNQNAFFHKYIIHNNITPIYSTGNNPTGRYLHHYTYKLASLYVHLKV